MIGRKWRNHLRPVITVLVAVVGLALVFGAATLAEPNAVGRALAQATTTTTARATTTVTTNGTTTTVTTTRATTLITNTAANTQLNSPPPPPPPPPAPNMPATGTGGLLRQHTPGSTGLFWLSLIGLLVLAGGVGTFAYARRR